MYEKGEVAKQNMKEAIRWYEAAAKSGNHDAEAALERLKPKWKKYFRILGKWIMVRGTTLFICTKCKKIFWAPDVEYYATIYSDLMPCKRCGSIRTMPLLMPYY